MKKRIGAYLLACAVAVSTMSLTGCNQQAVLGDVERFAPAITDVLIVSCEFTASPLCATAGPLLATAEQELFAVWQAYITAQANGTVTPGLWNDLNSALQTLISQSENVFALAHVVNGAHQQEVLALATAVEGLLAVIETFLPAPPASPAPTPAAIQHGLHPAGRLAASLPKPNPKTGVYDRAWLNSWVKGFNQLPAVKSHKMKLRGAGFWSSLGNGLGEAKFGG